MTSILSSISGQFNKSLILGTFLPTALFVILSVIFLVPLFPTTVPLLTPLQTLDAQWQVIGISLLTILLTGLLYNLNIPILRFYQGYPWQKSWLGQWRTRHYEAQFEAAHARWKGMRTLLRALPSDQEHYTKISSAWNEIGLRINSEFPKDKNFLLPTRMGNIIRSFEDYPYRQYGMESVTLWPHLIAVINKDYATEMGDARTSFNFMLNSSVLSIALALAILLIGLLYPIPLTSSLLWPQWLFEILGFVALAYWFYLLSISRASAWGDMVKGAFDLYRWDLLKQLGYLRVPTTMAEERDLWGNIYRQLLYGDTPTVPPADYAAQSAFAFAALRDNSGVVDLETARGVSIPDDKGRVTITLCVKNVDLRRRTATRAVVADTLPNNFDYEWGSAQIDGRPNVIEVIGANPIKFRIGDLKMNESVVLTYRALQRKT